MFRELREGSIAEFGRGSPTWGQQLHAQPQVVGQDRVPDDVGLRDVQHLLDGALRGSRGGGGQGEHGSARDLLTQQVPQAEVGRPAP